MSSFLFATQPVTGHVVPAVAIVRALVERGHDVRWYVGEKFRDRVESAGAEFVPYRQAYDYDDSDYDAAFRAGRRSRAWTGSSSTSSTCSSSRSSPSTTTSRPSWPGDRPT